MKSKFVEVSWGPGKDRNEALNGEAEKLNKIGFSVVSFQMIGPTQAIIVAHGSGDDLAGPSIDNPELAAPAMITTRVAKRSKKDD